MPPVPDVPRTTVLDRDRELPESLPSCGRTVGRCALTGLSGIGKSSMAARYTAEYLDAYNMVFWFDASNAPSTLVEGFP